MTIRDGLRTPIRSRPNVPIAIQVSNHLRGWMRREFANGGQLPSELVLATKLRVSRGTVRQALSILQHEGLISRRQGLGTFVNPNILGIPARIDFAYEFTELITAAGFAADVKTLEISPDCADAEAARRLGIQPGTPMLRVRKLFLADGRPAIYVDEVLPTGLIAEAYDPLELQKPIWHFLERRCHRQTKYVLSELLAIAAQDELACLLDVAPGSPTLSFSEVFYDVKNEPLVLAHIYFREQLVRFQALRKVSPVV
jgi:GntR family transcriptional regulator